MHMKESSKGSPSAHLKNSITYIMKEHKTEGGLWVGGNSGSSSGEVFKAFMDTKKDYRKLQGRQGYHFVITFKEMVEPEVANRIMADFCKEYLGDSYDHVFAVHTDTDRTHAHVVFNSVSRTTGLKYHYKKGDWKKHIQVVTDKVCKKHGSSIFEYEGRSNDDYGAWLRKRKGKASWQTIVRNDIDYFIPRVDSYDELLVKLKELEYHARTGFSRKHGRYLALTPKGAGHAVRLYHFGEGYTIEALTKRIETKEELPFYRPGKERERCSPKARVMHSNYRELPRAKFYHSAYQYYYIKRYLKNSVLYHYQNTRNYHALKETQRNAKICRYLIRNHIEGREQLDRKYKSVKNQLGEIRKERNAYYDLDLSNDERLLLSRYNGLERKHTQALTRGDEAELEFYQDSLEAFEEKYPNIVEIQVMYEKQKGMESVKDDFIRLKAEEALLKQIVATRKNKMEDKRWKNTITQPMRLKS